MDKRATVVEFGGQRQLSGVTPKIGEKAPNFSGLKEDMSTFNSQELDGTVRIYSVIPSIDTSVCALQTSRFNHEINERKDVNVVTISADTPFALKRFREDQNIDNMMTVSDQVSLSFGMKYGMVMDGVRLLARGAFVVDKNNVLRYAQVVEDATSDIDFLDALKFVDELRKE